MKGTPHRPLQGASLEICPDPRSVAQEKQRRGGKGRGEEEEEVGREASAMPQGSAVVVAEVTSKPFGRWKGKVWDPVGTRKTGRGEGPWYGRMSGRGWDKERN